MSASTTTAACAGVSDAAWMPVRSEPFTPRSYSWLRTGRKTMPVSACRTRSASWPSTTMTGSTPAAATRPTTRRPSVPPSTPMNSLFCPMRVDVPAASTTPATCPVRSGMDRLSFLAQVTGLLARDDRQQLRDDADGDLLGAVGAHAQADRREHTRIAGGVELSEDVVG